VGGGWVVAWWSAGQRPDGLTGQRVGGGLMGLRGGGPAGLQGGGLVERQHGGPLGWECLVGLQGGGLSGWWAAVWWGSAWKSSGLVGLWCGGQAGLWGRSLQSRGLVGLQGRVLAVQWSGGPVGWGCGRPMGQRPSGQLPCSFSKSWCGKAFHELGSQGAEVSALPVALPQLNVSPASQQGP
jgi:hypothetical protein